MVSNEHPESVKLTERPKLNLKPRSQLAKHLERNAERERSVTDFGFLTILPYQKYHMDYIPKTNIFVIFFFYAYIFVIKMTTTKILFY